MPAITSATGLGLILLVLLSAVLMPSCAQKIIPKKIDYRPIIRDLSDRNWEIRIAAIKKLARAKRAEFDPLLIEATRDEHPQVAMAALAALYVSIPADAYERVRYLAEFEKNENIRWIALRVLGRYKNIESGPIFITGLDARDWLIREASITGLLMIDDYSLKYVSIPSIIKALTDKHANVRIAALNNLSIKDAKIYQVLKKMLKKNLERRNTLLLGILKALTGYVLDEETRQLVIQLLIDPNTAVRLLAYEVLKEEQKLKGK